MTKKINLNIKLSFCNKDIYRHFSIYIFRMNKHKEGNNKQNKRKYNDNIFSRKNIETLLLETTDEQLLQHFTIPQLVTKMFVSVENILCSHNSIFIGGIDIIKIY